MICVYIRLSKEDAKEQIKREKISKSESVKNQKNILISWIKEYFHSQEYEIVDFFEDEMCIRDSLRAVQSSLIFSISSS